MTAIPPVARPPFGRKGLRSGTWIAQALVALLLALGASFAATRVAQVLLIGAAAGVLAASAVGLVVWADARAPRDSSGGPV